MIKLKWKVDPPPTGQYRSFEKRGWPSAEYSPSGETAAMIRCNDEYRPKNIKEGHAPLTLYVADYSPRRTDSNKARFEWRKVKRQFATLQEAKTALPKILKAHPTFLPDDMLNQPTA